MKKKTVLEVYQDTLAEADRYRRYEKVATEKKQPEDEIMYYREVADVLMLVASWLEETAEVNP